MHVWFVYLYTDEMRISSQLTSSCVDIVAYHMKQHLPGGSKASPLVLVLTNNDEKLAREIQQSLQSSMPCSDHVCVETIEDAKDVLYDRGTRASLLADEICTYFNAPFANREDEGISCEHVKNKVCAGGYSDLVVVMPNSSERSRLEPLIKSLTGQEDIGSVSKAQCVIHVHTRYGTACLCSPAEAPFRFDGSQDWFSANIPAWRLLVLPHLQHRAVNGLPVRMLELGSLEGRSAVWLLQNALPQDPKEGTRLVCVDHFDLLRTDAGRTRRAALEHNVELTGQQQCVDVRTGFTVPVLTELLREGAEFDFVYVDASHTRADVLVDAMLVWRCTAAGAVVVVDDYQWPNHPRRSPEHPAEGIDAFLSVHRHELEIVHVGYQLCMRRTTPAFCGFEWMDATEDALQGAVAPDGAVWRGRM
jgi:predicted O-methyltransferase YrrM